jgi:HEAT repeat protein
MPPGTAADTGRAWSDEGAGVIEGDSREQRVSALLRQVWLGLSAYRLYPGATERQGFVSATERIEAASERALADGVVDVEVHGEALWLDARPLPTEDAIRRLALACFERRVERFVVRSVPAPAELAHLFDVLSLPPTDLQDPGAAEDRLRATGVTSVELLRVGPAPVTGADHVPEDLGEPEQAEIPDADMLASELMLEDLGGDAGQQAETILARLHSLAEQLHVEPARGIELHTAFHEAIGRFPDDVRRSLVQLLVDRVAEDPLAQRLVGAMSNAELTRALVDLGRDGRRDPVDLARRLAAAGVRHLDIVDLTSALEAGREEAGTIVAGLEQLGIDLSGPRVSGSVTDVLAEYLAATRSEDARAMQRSLGETEEEQAALLAFADYLALEGDLERVGEVLDGWSDAIGRSLRDGDRAHVGVLVDAARRPLADAGDDRSALFEASARHALDAELLLELAPPPAEGEPSPLPALLAPFGDLGVEVLLDLLAAEEDRDRRALLLAVLRQAAAGHVGPVAARLDDPRWYVVRNAVTLLGAAGGPEVLERLASVARHGTPEVRREAARSLVLAGGAAAAPHLVDLAIHGEDELGRLALVALAALTGPQAASALADVARSAPSRPLRQEALDVLGGRADGGSLLEDLASGSTRPKLPWALRRHARRLLRERKKAMS